ncbi:UDP-N-acetylglucosamine--undecaprenyl-phosphate N-acetylglucosaminephosphotransferase [Erwinia sp. AnSW2-5]|uniref:UDP-N-acetylglucosamine--undecaprenyl-phosphate N-acetylglucosaminephosphotransferase n=1 Tax=Erwinia sp. AnSW2-5 TaxID=3367692 RepID=UPI00385EB237
MQDIVLLFPGALVLLFMARKVARRVGLVDKPNARKHHKGSIPLVGGVSIYFSIWLLFGLQPGWLPEFPAYMCCITLLLIVGGLDDRFDLPVLPRVLLQVGVAGIMMLQGLYLSSLGNVLFGYPLVLGAAGYMVTVFAVIGAINAFNMVDGIDGLLGSLSCVTLGALGIVFWLGGSNNIAKWCLSLMAACLPYILLNLGIPWGKKFKVFMGDAGSMLIGFTVIWLLIVASQGPEAVMWPVTALWLIAVPLMDMIRVMMARVKKGCSPFRPDREHFHHILLRCGFSAHISLFIPTVLSIALAMIGIFIEKLNVSSSISFFLILIIFYLYLKIINLLSKISAAKNDNISMTV